MAKRKKYKVGDRVFYEYYDGTIGTATVVEIIPETYINDYGKEVGYDWLGYKVEVAKELIRPCYEEAKAAAKQSGGLRPAKDVAIEDAIEMAVDMAEKLERRLKGGK